MSNTYGMKNTVNAANLMTDLMKENEQLLQENAELHAKRKWLEEQCRLGQQRRFGASSERSDETQLQLFNEAESDAQPLRAEPTMEKITYERRKQRGHREAVLEDLPVETVEYRLPAEEHVCSCRGGPLHEMSTNLRIHLPSMSCCLTRHPCRTAVEYANNNMTMHKPLPYIKVGAI